ncbi:unnamed protein product [Bubo scandiacus]
MVSKGPAVRSFLEQTTSELFALMDIAWWCNGWVLGVEVDDDNMRTPSVLADFAQDLCGTGDRAKLQLVKRMEEEEEEKVQPRLVFMLWQANMLKQLMQWDHLDEALWDVRNLLPSLLEVLVLVMIQPDPQEQLGQALRALRRMQCLLYGAWQLPVEAAVYSPGQPDGILEAKRAACRALREVLNFHEGFSYCCGLPEYRQHRKYFPPGALFICPVLHGHDSVCGCCQKGTLHPQHLVVLATKLRFFCCIG